MSTINTVGLKALKRPELQKLAKTHGIKANLKSEAMIVQLLARFPGGVPLDVIKVEDDVRVNPADEDASQGAKADEPPVCPSPKKNATRAKTMKKRQARKKVAPAEEPAVVARSGLAISVPHPETVRPSREEPRRAEMSASMHAGPEARVTSAPHSPIPPAPQPDTDVVPSHPPTTMPSVSMHAPPTHDQTMSTDAFASGRPAWVPVHDPHMPPDADAGWTPSTAPPNRAPSPPPPPPPPRAESEEPRATEEQARTAVAIIADISKKHKERWAEVNAFEERVERACRSAANLRTLERAQRIRMHDYLAYWNPGVGSEWKDEEIWDRVRPTRFDEEGCEVEVLSDDEDAFREQFPLPPGAKATELIERRHACRRNSQDQDVRVSEVLDLTEDRKLNLNGVGKKRRHGTPAEKPDESEERELKRARRLATPAKATGRVVPTAAIPVPVLGAITEDSEC